MIRTVDVVLGERGYPVSIGTGLIDRARTLFDPGRRAVIVSDTTVAPLYLQRLMSGLAAPCEAIVLPPGEATKSWSQLEALVERLLKLGVERGDRIIALGGGVIGDLVGFAAAITRRGCGFVQVPTTLLAQVDSSVGGKTAINARAGKNLVGAFHQPDHVLIDVEVLQTLPDRELRAGYAEVVKYGLIGDAGFFDWCSDNVAGLMGRAPDMLLHAVETSVRAKAAVVGADERETRGQRALLNLGHTFGHALEADAGFSARLLHGEAVAIGMALAFRYSARRGDCDAAAALQVARHLRAAGLPAAMAEASLSPSPAALIAHMRQDKKMSGGTLPFILARGIGAAFLAQDVDLADIEAFLADELAAERQPA